MERPKFKTNNISKEITENDIIENITDICVKQNLTIEATHKFRSKRVIGYALINSVNHCFKFKKPHNLLMYIKIIDEHKSDDLLSYGFYKAQRDISINFFIDEQKIKNITVIINEKNLNYIYEYISFILTHLRKSSMINFDDLETVQKDFFDEYGEIDKEGNITYEKPFTKVRCNNIMYPLDRYSVGCDYPARCINSILFNDGKAIEIKHSNSVDIISISNFKNHFDAIVDENGNIIPNKDDDNNSENTEFTKVKFINKLESTPYLNSILEIGNYYYARWNNNKKIIIIYEQPNRRLSPKGIYTPKLFQESFDAKIDENGNIIPNKENKEEEKEDMTTYRMRNTIKDLPRTVTVLCTKTLETKAQLYPAGQYFYAYADEDDIIYIDGEHNCCCPISKDKFLNHFDAKIDNDNIIPNDYVSNIKKLLCIKTDKRIIRKRCYYVELNKVFNDDEYMIWECTHSKDESIKDLTVTKNHKLISKNIIDNNFEEIISIETATKIIQEKLDLKPSEILKYTDVVGDDMLYLKYNGDIITLDTNSLANPEYYSVSVSIATNDETHRFASRNVYLTNKSINELCDFITFLNPRLNQETVKDDTL